MVNPVKTDDISFVISKRLCAPDGRPLLGRTGLLSTPHGSIATPAFIPVGTNATVKALTVEQLHELGAAAVLANAYHLYLRPGPDIVEAGGGLAQFMNWNGPTFTDSGGFQVMSLGTGFNKVLSAEFAGDVATLTRNIAKDRLARVDDEGVTFKSHIDGSLHRFTPEVSMQIQHSLGADIIFAFDELTSLLDDKRYQISALERTHNWGKRCLLEHNRLSQSRTGHALQSLWGVVQGAQYEDLRRQAAKGLTELSRQFEDQGLRGFGGYGIGGALQKETMGETIRWVCEELPDNKPRHLLGISEPEDIFAAVELGIETFDCVHAARIGRHGTLYTRKGKICLKNQKFQRDFGVIDESVPSYTCRNYTRAYLRHLLKANEYLANTLFTIHNLFFIVTLVNEIRQAIEQGSYWAYKAEFFANYPVKSAKT